MLFEIDIEEGPARFAEMMATIDAGFGVLVRRGGVVVARLVPEAAFAALEGAAGGDDGLTPEEREMREMFELLDADMNGVF
jgi:antitoxin (DNA-binding transcriptional repressor) of toxin-antitoxin stability system